MCDVCNLKPQETTKPASLLGGVPGFKALKIQYSTNPKAWIALENEELQS